MMSHESLIGGVETRRIESVREREAARFAAAAFALAYHRKRNIEST